MAFSYRQARSSQRVSCRKSRPLHVERLEIRALLTAAGVGDEFQGLLTSAGACSCPICSGRGLQDQVLQEIVSSAEPVGSDGDIVAAASAGGVPKLSSLPGARATIFLDFDGHTEARWGEFKNVVTPAYDRDGDRSSFSSGEIAAIQEIWARVAEDYSPFNINVTTIEPPLIANGVAVRVAIGGNDSDWFENGAGGVAYVGGFYNGASNVAYVFEDALNNGNPRYTAEAASHEAGHTFGLLHQAKWNGNKLVEDYNSGTSALAPIMGVGYYSTRTTWHNGTSDDGPNAFQDDMAILANSTNGFGYRADDFGSSTATASPLSISGTTVNVTGVVERNGDIDVFSFSTSGGAVNFALNVAQFGANLDSVLELLSATGQILVTANPATSLGASIATTLGGGAYFLAVRSSGGYGNVGQYTLTGTVPAVATSPEIALTYGSTELTDGGILDFGSTTPGSPVSRTITVRNVGGQTLTLSEVSSSLPDGFSLVTNLTDTSLDAGESTTFTIQLDASALGTFGGVISLANSDADEGPFDLTLAGTVTSIPTSPPAPPPVPPTPVVQIIDNGASGFFTKGAWRKQTKIGHESDILFAYPGSGSYSATWKFTGLEPGTYRVSATWPKGKSYASNAPFTIKDGSTALETVKVNQRTSPSGLSDDGSKWTELGEFTIQGNRLIVKLTNKANARVIADAIRIERIPSPAAVLAADFSEPESQLTVDSTSNDLHSHDHGQRHAMPLPSHVWRPDLVLSDPIDLLPFRNARSSPDAPASAPWSLDSIDAFFARFARAST